MSQDFQLLCRDGSRADVTEWRQCNLARVPAHAVVVRDDTNGGLIFQLLNEGQVRRKCCALKAPRQHRALRVGVERRSGLRSPRTPLGQT